MKRATAIPTKTRAGRITALVAFALLAALAAFQLNDARLALTDFDAWWGERFHAMYPGNDFVAVTYTAEREDGYNNHYRAIAIGMAVKRSAGIADPTLRAPAELFTLWGTSPDDATAWREPGISEDYFTDLTTGADLVPYAEDPRVSPDTVTALEGAGTMNRLSWNVAYLTTGQVEDDISIVTDDNREWVYVVPTRILEESR